MRPSITPWIRAAVGIGALPFLLAGCGDGNLVVAVDILSYLDASERTAAYSIPGGIAVSNVDVASRGMNLLPGIEDATDLVTASAQIEAAFDHQSGDALGVLYFHMASGDSADPFTTPPLDSIPVSLTPGSVVSVSREISSPALAQALVQKRALIGVRVTYDTRATPPVGTAAGTMTLTKLTAVVVTQRDF
jgi:hypothetical protein